MAADMAAMAQATAVTSTARATAAVSYNAWQAPRRHRDHTGRNVAIGAFAAILGLGLAAEANRTQHRYYEDRD